MTEGTRKRGRSTGVISPRDYPEAEVAERACHRTAEDVRTTCSFARVREIKEGARRASMLGWGAGETGRGSGSISLRCIKKREERSQRGAALGGRYRGHLHGCVHVR